MVIKGLKGIPAAETSISFIDGDKGILIYRGHEASRLALSYSFEEVAYLLWKEKFPDNAELLSFKEELALARELPEYLVEMLYLLPENMEIMDVLRTCISAIGTKEYNWKPSIDQAIRLTAIMPVLIASRYRINKGLSPIEPMMDLGHTANYLYMLTGEIPTKSQEKAMDAYMILTAEHGMNASTFAARVTASTESDMVSAVTAAIGAMKGPLHGGAPTAVLNMLDEIQKEENAEVWIREKLDRNEKIMGFGHRIYKTRDPRAAALQEITRGISGDEHWLSLANSVEEKAISLLEEYKPGRKLYTNVEFYAAAIMKAIDMEAALFTPTFTAARTAGWTAHVLEQSLDNAIYRPESVYTGPFYVE
ncbi:citrate synthase/methylcitrate synthase [Bacillus sp. CECT 9360]|uniref:citrate synthase/methylcitrate synthase n=1 Tax=Bacillus sp. CECT 9360 TaxID=2845821 RepID=UPI001E305335|nr:citrate synthase/methylcitrate synthase [Bacillus sp. CECT 9360]CAH0347203.1 Citrate synthase 1 [Bacillus sp. CECT 9360]